MANGNGKDSSADAMIARGFEEDEEEFNYSDNVGKYNEDEEVIPPGVSPPFQAAEPTTTESEHAPVSNAETGGAQAGSDRPADTLEVGNLSGAAPDSASGHAVTEGNHQTVVAGGDSLRDVKQPGAGIPHEAPKPAAKQAASVVEKAEIAEKPRSRVRWLRVVLIIATVMLAAGFGYWKWPFGELFAWPAIASITQAESATSPAGDTAPTPPPDQPPMEPLGERLNALIEEIEAFEGDGSREDINAFLGDPSQEAFNSAPQDGMSEVQDQPGGAGPGESAAVSIAAAQLEGIESLLTGLHDRLGRLEEEQRELAQSAKAVFETSRPAHKPPANAAAEEQTGLAQGSDPVRAGISQCGADGQAVIKPLGAMQLAAHEGADGRRWVRVIGSGWRRDLASGDRLPVGSPGEARLWVDEAGVFGVVDLPGRPPCRLLLKAKSAE